MGSVYLRGNSWVLKYKDENGKWRRKTVGKKPAMTKTMGRLILSDIERRVKLGQYKVDQTESPTLIEFSKEYLYYQEKIRQLRSYERTKISINHFIRILKDIRLKYIDATKIDEYKQKRLSEGVKINTIARELQVIRNMFNHASKRDKYFGKNPVTESGLPKFNDNKVRVLTKDEEKILLEYSPRHLHDIILIALNTGMRRGEILGMRWSWINMEENIIILPHTHTKTNLSRKVPINSVIRKILLERKLISGGSNFIFPSEESKTGHLSWVRHSFITACKKANITELRFHDLRHTAATRLVESGIPLHTVSKLLGHSSVSITERYSHPESSVVTAVNVLAGYTVSNF